MASGLSVTVSVFFWVTFALAAVALFAPFWVTNDFPDIVLDRPLRSQGQLLVCVDPYNSDDARDCEWIVENDDVELPDELKASQYLSIIGTGLFLLGGVITFLGCCMQNSLKSLAASLLLIGLLGSKHI